MANEKRCQCTQCGDTCTCQKKSPPAPGQCCCGATCTCGPNCPCDPSCGCPSAKKAR